MLDNHATLTNPNAIGAVLSAPFPLADTARAAVAPLTIADGESGPCFYGEPEFVSSFCLRCGHAKVLPAGRGVRDAVRQSGSERRFLRRQAAVVPYAGH